MFLLPVIIVLALVGIIFSFFRRKTKKKEETKNYIDVKYKVK